ncbi:MAG: 5-formyltetrahydrofolate cyclo-ligase [Bacteroidetes bacterium]|nr:5-formyltetrahydrofolate cyclo-ligase [Bacteroidota bacterium]MDA1120991.1 5-formyltetrahydrofolate cyclo-ligase [Bacteroidota bacterium]
MNTKAEVRKQFLDKRLKLSDEQIAILSRSVALNLFANFQWKRDELVHVFLPIKRQNEIDTWSIIRDCWKMGLQVVVSQSDFGNGNMSHFLLNPETRLVENKWGIPEPVDGELVAAASINIVLVPLIAFDTNGHRIGYGKGFYDKFLSECRPDVRKIGLSFFPPADKINSEAHDVILDHCVTPDKVYSF